MSVIKIRPYSFDCLKEDIASLCSAYPFLKSFSIGKTPGGRDLFCLNWGEGNRHLLLNGAHHGMEWITSLLLMRFGELCARHYAEKTSVGTLSFASLYHQITLSLCPMVNPDGVELALKGPGDDLPPVTRTKLLAYNQNSPDFSKWQANLHGVDLNHNYNADFEKGVFCQHKLGIYGPGPTRYSGPYPESEAETSALADYTRSFLPHIAVAYHTQGQVIYHDFDGRATEKSHEMAENMAELSGYQLDKTDDMASFSGYKDWVIKDFAIPAFTIEAGLGENPLPLSQFEKIFADNLKIFLYLLRA